MDSGAGDGTSLPPGFPIRKPPDQRSVASSPGTIAGSHVLHRLLMPRHPPCALHHLTHPPTPTNATRSAHHTDRHPTQTLPTQIFALHSCGSPASTHGTHAPQTADRTNRCSRPLFSSQPPTRTTRRPPHGNPSDPAQPTQPQAPPGHQPTRPTPAGTARAHPTTPPGIHPDRPPGTSRLDGPGGTSGRRARAAQHGGGGNLRTRQRAVTADDERSTPHHHQHPTPTPDGAAGTGHRARRCSLERR
jgi:hypothetical protein